MKVTFKSTDGRMVIEGDCQGVKKAFQFMGLCREFFLAEPCGCCKSKNTAPDFHEAKGYKFYEWKCGDCGATFQFGQHKEGDGLFPKRKDANNNALPNKGWSVYQANGSGQAPHSQEPNREPQDYSQEDVPF